MYRVSGPLACWVATAALFISASANTYADESAALIVHYFPSIYNLKNANGNEYEAEVLRLALAATEADYGPFTLVQLPHATTERTIRDLAGRKLENQLQVMGYKPERLAQGANTFISFPVYLGIFGYRVCFANESVNLDVNTENPLDELKRFSFGSGDGWSDTYILQSNGFAVRTATVAGRLARMTAVGQVDFFCRSVGEFNREFKSFSHLEGLKKEKTFALFYPHPRFFFTNRHNKLLIDRVTVGLQRVYASGEYQRLWQEVFGESISYADLPNRKIVTLKNPLVDGLDRNYERYFYQPASAPATESSQEAAAVFSQYP